MDATLADALLGQVLDGRYRIQSRIASGGMATVYIATDTRLDRTVALKIMHKELARDGDFVGRFIDEAKAVARLSHPNVVAVFDQGSDGEHLYLAMEYVPGRTLRDLLNEHGRLGPGEGLDLMVPVLAGLGAAHRAGLVHRDVKPENVLIAGDGRVKVVDFGLARSVAQTRQTRTGLLLGTVAYLAPEQVSSATADARSDVYAAGVMLFELLTGRQPYVGETPLAVAYQHVNATVPAPSRLVPGLPAAVDALVAFATSHNPDLRPHDAGQFLRAVFDARRTLPGGSAFAAQPAASPSSQQEWPARPEQQAAYSHPDQPGSTVLAYGTASAPGGVLGAGPPSGAGQPAAPAALGDVAAGDAARGSVPAGGQAPAADTPTERLPSARAGTGGVPPHQPMMLGVPGAIGGSGVPGLRAAPAPPAFGARAGIEDRAAVPGAALAAARGTALPHRRGANNTLVVSRGHGDHARRRLGLGDWLFSRRVVYLAGGLVVALVAGLLVWWQAAGRFTQVPNVTGLTTTTATAELRNLGFAVKLGAPQTDNVVPKGYVARTLPAIGTHAPNGATITVIPSAGPRMILVPNVTGKPLAGARQALIAAGLTAGTIRQETSATVPSGEVISTDPAAGTLWPQTKPIVITQSAGIGLPDFTGQPKQAAEQWLQQHQLQVQEQPVNSTTQPQDNVVRQSPAANTPVTQGEVVTLYISAGPPMVQIPDVTGQSVHDARKQLEALGFQVSIVGFGDGSVIAYNPTGQAPKGSTITLVAAPGGNQP